MRKQYVISLDDLRHVSIECPRCRARVTLDMKERPELPGKQPMFAPKICPGCHEPYDSAIQPNVDALQRAYQSLAAIADRIRFVGEAADE